MIHVWKKKNNTSGFIFSADVSSSALCEFDTNKQVGLSTHILGSIKYLICSVEFWDQDLSFYLN